MRALLDECIPHPVHQYFKQSGLDVQSVHELGWDGVQNGELLAMMIQHGFDVLITVDQNLVYQQNLTDTKISIISIKALSNKTEDIKPAIPRVLNAILSIAEGQIIQIEV